MNNKRIVILVLFLIVCILVGYKLTFIEHFYTTTETDEMVYNPPAHLTNTKEVIEELRYYSSIWGGEKNKPHSQGHLDSYQAWSAQTNNSEQWMIIDLGGEKTVTGVITQGRVVKNRQWVKIRQWVKTYTVYYTNLEVYPDPNEEIEKWLSINNEENVPTFTGNNSDISKKEYRKFSEPVSARYIMIQPKSWNNHISMRAGLIVKKTVTTPVMTGSMTPVTRQVTTPVMTGSMTPVTRQVTTPVMTGSMTPVTRQVTTPVTTGVTTGVTTQGKITTWSQLNTTTSRSGSVSTVTSSSNVNSTTTSGPPITTFTPATTTKTTLRPTTFTPLTTTKTTFTPLTTTKTTFTPLTTNKTTLRPTTFTPTLPTVDYQSKLNGLMKRLNP
jgi:hypothetical protein